MDLYLLQSLPPPPTRCCGPGLPACLSFLPSVGLPVCLLAYLPTRLSFCLPACLSLSVSPSVSPVSACPSVCRSTALSARRLLCSSASRSVQAEPPLGGTRQGGNCEAGSRGQERGRQSSPASTLRAARPGGSGQRRAAGARG